MMREKEFKVWDKEGKKIIYPTEIMSITSIGQVHIMNISDDNLIPLFFIGRKDDYGHKLYYKDIIKFSSCFSVSDDIGVITWSPKYCAFWILFRYGHKMFNELTKIKSLGSYFENPGLLEGKE
jgi:hypothetical protein